MIKGNKCKVGLLVLGFVLYLHVSGLMAADICPGPFSTLPDNYYYDAGCLLKCDPDNPQEIDPNSSIEISVIGGFPPFIWQVSGSGFYLSLNETEDPSNSLYTDDTACGTAEIKITNRCRKSVTCYVRCTTGRWGNDQTVDLKNKGDFCPNDSCKTSGCMWRNEPVCEGASNCYRWFVTAYYSSTNWHCPDSNCGPDDDGKTGVCKIPLSDGACTYIVEDFFCGFCVAFLSRQEWICP